MTVAVSAGVTMAAGRRCTPGKEEQAPQQRAVVAGSNTLPTAKIGKLTLSRLISGGNLISGWAPAILSVISLEVTPKNKTVSPLSLQYLPHKN